MRHHPLPSAVPTSAATVAACGAAEGDGQCA